MREGWREELKHKRGEKKKTTRGELGRREKGRQIKKKEEETGKN